MNAALLQFRCQSQMRTDCDTVHVCLMDAGTYAEVECVDGVVAGQTER